MATARGRVTAVEEFSGSDTWPVKAKWRVKIDDRKWVYADTVAFAGGLGTPNRLGAISDALEGVLKQGGRITYAQQTLIPPVPGGATIIVIGDSGTAGWAAQEAVRTGHKAIIVARSEGMPNMPPHLRRYISEHSIPVVQGDVKTASLDAGQIALGLSPVGSAAVSHSINGDGISIAIGQATVLPKGMDDLHFRMLKRVDNGKERVVGLEAYDPETGQATGLVVQGAAMTTRPFKEGPTPVVDDRADFKAALKRQASDDDVPEFSRGVEPSIHQSARNIPLGNERPQ
jgi:hypothetical protein